MALIKCPECGREVSDKAKNCIHCGCPLGAPDNSVKIKIKYFPGSNIKFNFIDEKTGKTLAEGFKGETITLQLDKPTTIRCHAGLAKDGFLEYIPHENAKYNVFLNPKGGIRNSVIFNEVDYIDSD